MPELRIAVLVSSHGRGTNLQAILDGCAHGTVNGRVAVVVGTRDDSPAMDRARMAGVPAVVVSPKAYEGDERGYSDALLDVLGRYGGGLVCLVGYMRMVPETVGDR